MHCASCLCVCACKRQFERVSTFCKRPPQNRPNHPQNPPPPHSKKQWMAGVHQRSLMPLSVYLVWFRCKSFLPQIFVCPCNVASSQKVSCIPNILQGGGSRVVRWSNQRVYDVQSLKDKVRGKPDNVAYRFELTVALINWNSKWKLSICEQRILSKNRSSSCVRLIYILVILIPENGLCCRQTRDFHSPRNIFLSWCPWHRYPWQLLFCCNVGQCLPPFWAACRICLFRVIMPVPQLRSHSLQAPQSPTWQSSTEMEKRTFVNWLYVY